MPRNQGFKTVNNFSRGLITEATALNFPPDCVTSATNTIFHQTSKATRRKGLQLEDGYASLSLTVNSVAFNTFLWENVDGQADLNFAVVQTANIIRFYEVDDTTALSANRITSFTIDIDTFKISGAPSVNTIECQFVSGFNYLFITHPYCNPMYVRYDSASSTFDTPNFVYVLTRDFDGIEDSLDVETQPATLSDEHKYNLYNQGWYLDVEYSAGSSAQAVTRYYTVEAVYPSNAEIWWLYKNSTNYFDPGNLGTRAFGNTNAPKGHYIIEAFHQDRASSSGIAGLAVVSSSYYRPSAVGFGAGRVWYAGTNYGSFTNKIYFSQILESIDQAGLCYQANDPTSENAFDLLPSDGGVISIPEMGTPHKLLYMQTSMIVFASNGIWAISGSGADGTAFRADDYSITKITSIGSLSAGSIIQVEGNALFWNKDGIYSLGRDQLGNLAVTPISDNTIKSYFKDIPVESKKYAKAVFNPVDKVISWLYKSTAPSTTTTQYTLDTVLNLNTITGAFYPYSFDDTARICGVLSSTGFSSSGNSHEVKYLTAFNISGSTGSLSFSELRNTSYVDWSGLTGGSVDYDSNFTTSYNLDGDAVRFIQSNYVWVFMDTETNASCYVQGHFDWANHSDSGKFSTKQQAYSTNGNRSIRVRRLKIRGSGRAIQLKFTSEAGKPFTIIGWSLWETGNSGA